ncbi:hypothetical protein AQ930_16845 [Burkholderia pseudomallei]|nr:hypothetical protein AQ926_16925 [Burkholderia pseudomallei]OND20452.1 hypothetical protein AQ930_16845 [Burkholderia pseudomallei]
MNVKRGANAPARAHGAQAARPRKAAQGRARPRKAAQGRARPRKAARAGLARPARRFVTSDRSAACS